jgi:hypothetical protein
MKHKTLYNKLHSFAPKFEGIKTRGQVMWWVRKMLSPYNVKVSRIIDKTNNTISALTVGGFYDPSVDYDEKDIGIYVIFSEQDDKVWLDSVDIQVMINEIFKTLVHEKKHKYQFKQRGLAYGPVYRLPKSIEDEKLADELVYYGDPDEIDAYAQEAIIEERLYGRSDTKAKYKELFDIYDKKVYNSFLKKYYLYDRKVTL